MIPKLPNYQIGEKIYEGERTVVYRGQRVSDSLKVIIKFLRNEYPSFSELVQFRNQYAIAKNLKCSGIVRPLSLESVGNGYALVMEDLGAIALDKAFADDESLDLGRCLEIAIQLADILHELDRHRVIHKDIKPANILIEPETKQVKLIDFSIASLLPKEAQEIKNFNVLEGTLAYISPEQTGRMNRGIDYRSDFYSLGVTFYELLTGTLPFSSDDPMELVHCHLSQQPRNPVSLRNRVSEIPPAVSDIVMKLMAKNAEDRYQSALGLKFDLEKCLNQWTETGKIEAFELAERDIADRFVIPEKLYGREAEVAQLLAAFSRVAASPSSDGGSTPMAALDPSSELMLVAGFSGIGKTAVINEVHKPIVRQRGYFIKGKFDQFQRNIPFSALIEAFEDLMEQLHSESDAQLQSWKTRILDALGANGQVIIEAIPSLEKIIGKQPPPLQVSGNAAQNRFNLLFQKFIKVFATADHPLVIFVDDLQWADAASLKLMQLLTEDSQTGYLLLLGAYRDNEVFPTHPLILTLDEIRKSGATLDAITLAPLAKSDLNRLVADTLNCEEKLALPLTELLYQKTKGNPFFATQFLKGLHEDGWIKFNFDAGYWQCDMTGVRELALSDDVVEFMTERLHKLPEKTQEILKIAACIGNRFDLATLAVASDRSEVEVADGLWAALQEGLLLPVTDTYKFFQGSGGFGDQTPTGSILTPLFNGGTESPLTPLQNAIGTGSEISVSYKFLHDRIQQAAYSLIPEELKQKTHLTIGQLLLKNSSEKEREEKLFDIVDRLNIGASLLRTPEERKQLCELNLQAGLKAKIATAYKASLEYLLLGIELLPENSWEHQYDLTLALYEAATESAYLSGDFLHMEEFAEVALTKSRHLLDTIAIYEVKIQTLLAQLRFKEAIAIAMGVLKKLGIRDFPENPDDSHTQLGLDEVRRNLADRHPRNLIDLPVMSNPSKLAAIRLLAIVTSATYIAAPRLMPLIIFEQVNLSIQYGNAPVSVFAYASLGLVLCGLCNETELGYQFGELASDLLLMGDKTYAARTLHVINAHVTHYKKHLRATFEGLKEAYSVGIETGELEFAGYAALYYSFHSYLSGRELSELDRQLYIYSDNLERIKQTTCKNYIDTYRQAIDNLLGRSENPCLLVGEAYNESEMLAVHEEANDVQALYHLNINRTILCYLFGDYDRAAGSLAIAEKYLGGGSSTPLIPLFYFYRALVTLARIGSEPESNRQEQLERIAADLEILHHYASNAPVNYLHKCHLVEAERYRVSDDKVGAIELYDRAIAGAKENEYIQEEALANELAAKFYLDWGKEKIARTYMTDAYYGYAKWGATAKVQDLETQYPQLLKQLKQQAVPKTRDTSIQSTIVKTTLGSSGALDLATVMKASLAISSEIVLDKLLAKLIHILLENAGAEKAFLFLKEKGELGLAASIKVNEEAIVYQPLVASTEALPLRDLPLGVINYVQRTGNHLMLADAQTQGLFTNDPYITDHQVKSLLCAPIIKGTKLVGIIYLENNLTAGAFTSSRLKVLQLLSGQAAISLELARSVNQVSNTLAYLTTIINNIADGLLVTDGAGRITQFNPALSNLFGVPASELTGQYCTEALSSEIGAIVTQSFSHPTEILSAEIPLSSGRIGGAVATAITSDESDEIIGCVTIIRDITAEKEIDRMKTDFISTVSHELRTPLTSVVGFAKIIHKKLNDKVTPALGDADKKTVRAVRQIGDNINIIISEGERLTTLINDVLDIAKMEAGKIEWHNEPVNLGEILTRAVNATASLWQTSGLKLIKELSPELPEVNGDAARLLQVVINLISNAVKFTASGSITLKASQADGQIIVSVIDTGVGIKPADCEQVFEKFKQVGEVMTDKPQGTGLGLPICKQIIEHHQGRIWVESELGVGSNFSFALPLESPIDGEVEPLNIDTLVRQLKQSIVPKSSESTTQEQKTILVVDDEASIRTLLRQQLEDQGYMVKEAADGMEAISQVKLSPPDLIILDVMMPAINGFDVAAVLKNNPTTMEIPIIILSIVEDKERGWKLGVDRYLTKPIDSDKLLSDIGVLISRGTSSKKVMVVDRDVSAIKTLTEVLEAKGYSVVEALSGPECIQKALQEKPDMIIVDSVMSQQHDLVKTLRFEKGLENVFFVLLAGQS